MNAIGTQMRDPINSGLTRRRMAVLNKPMDTAAEIGRDLVNKHQIKPENGDGQVDAGRDSRARLAKPNSQARTGTEKHSFLCSADHEQDWQPYPIDSYAESPPAQGQ